MTSGSERKVNELSRLKITLKSDLCSASGDGFSSLIDTDVSYDKFGFPYIGGRRLKGCLREAAVQIGSDYIDEIFGVSGRAYSGSLRISDARISGIEKLWDEAAADDKLNAEKNLSLFTYTRASTAIENDTAKDNSLRFTRVIRHYSPFGDGNEELVFYADVSIGKEYEKEFADICRALRNIGYKRNRGFGAVKCEFICEEQIFPFIPENTDGDELQIEYTVRLESNVMISMKKSNDTADYITGTSVIGLLAGEYLKNSDADSRFEEIFLKNNVRFSNLYISDRNGRDYFPAPVIIGKIKGESNYYNILRFDDTDEKKIIKPLKSGFCDYDLNVVSPVTETIYHHSKTDNSTLYTQTSICSDQYFKGTITGKAEYIKELYELLCKCDICFGKSRSAQYSRCRLVKSSIKNAVVNENKLRAGERFIALAVSDILIPDGMGGYDITADGMREALGYKNLEFDKDRSRKRSALKYKTVSGFNTQWNMQKPSVRAIASGSALIFTAEEDMILPEIKYIGTKQNEGFGKVMLIPADRLKSVSEKNTDKKNVSTEKGQLSELLEKNEMLMNMRKEAIRFAEENEAAYSDNTITKSQVGRFVLFVKHSGTFDEFTELLKSDINDNKEHRSSSVAAFEKIVEKSDAEKYRNTVWKDYLLLILTLIKYYKRREKNDNE